MNVVVLRPSNADQNLLQKNAKIFLLSQFINAFKRLHKPIE